MSSRCLAAVRAERMEVAAAARGESQALEQLARRWLPVVQRWCERQGGPWVDPHDAAQDVFLVVLRRLNSLRSPECFPAWLHRITQYVLSQHRRQLWWQRRATGPLEAYPDPGNSPIEHAATHEACRIVHQVLLQLPGGQREALLLCLGEERSSSEVALLLSLPAGTVRSRIRLGRRRFVEEADGAGVLPALHSACSGS